MLIGFNKSVVLSALPNPTIDFEIPLTVPVNVGEARFAFSARLAVTSVEFDFKSNAVCVAVDTGLFASLVLSTLFKPIIVLSMPVTMPVNVGDSIGAFKFNAVCAAVDIGLFASLVLSAFPNPTIVFVTPPTVPVNVGDSIGAFNARPNVTSDEFALLFKIVCVAVDTGLLISLVLSTFPKPTIDFAIPPTVPVNVGLLMFAFSAKLVVTSVVFAFKFKAVCVAVDIGLFTSLVLSTLFNPTIVLSIPPTVPVNVGLLIFAFSAKLAVTSVAFAFKASTAVALVVSWVTASFVASILADSVAVSDLFMYGFNILAVSAIFNFKSKPATLLANNAKGTVQNCEVPMSTYCWSTIQLVSGTDGATAAFKFKKYGPADQSKLAIEVGPDSLCPLPITIVNTPVLDAVT